MRNLGSVLAAYLAVWGVFFIYHFTLSRRLIRLQEEVRRLKQTLKQ